MSGGMEHGAAKRTSRMTMANIKSQHTEDTGNSRAGNANLATFGSKIYTNIFKRKSCRIFPVLPIQVALLMIKDLIINVLIAQILKKKTNLTTFYRLQSSPLIQLFEVESSQCAPLIGPRWVLAGCPRPAHFPPSCSPSSALRIRKAVICAYKMANGRAAEGF